MKCFGVFFVLLTVIILLLAGCATVEGDFKKAKSIDTIAAYERFIMKYPETKYAIEAKEAIAFKEAEMKNSTSSYMQFVQKHNNSKFVPIALERINESDESAFARTCR